MVPGQNLLQMAFSVVTYQTVSYYQATGRSLNLIGQYVTTYAEPIPVIGSFQAVPRSRYAEFGLDLNKNYYTFYTLTNMFDVERDISADQIRFDGQLFQVQANNDWFSVDGWKGCLVVQVPTP